MAEAAPAPAPVEAAKSGPNADPSQFNAQKAMNEWAAPVEAAKANAVVAGFEGAQSSLPRDKKGNIIPNRPDKSRVTRVLPDSEVLHDGSVEHLNKTAVKNAAEKAAALKGYVETPGISPVEAIPALREKRIAEIKATLIGIAHRHSATGGSEKVTDSVAQSRALKAELLKLTAISRAEAEAKLGKAPKAGTQAEGHKTPNSLDKPPVKGTQGEGQAPRSANPFESTPKSERIIRTFVDGNGRPLDGFYDSAAADGTPIPGLNTILAERVALGDESDWNNLVQTMRDAVKNDANHRLPFGGESTQQRLAEFEKYAHDKYKELKGNQSHGGETPGELLIMPAELQTKLNDARAEFVRLSVKRRGISLGSKHKLADAKKAYDEARNEAGIYIADQLLAAGADKATVASFGKAGAIIELHELADAGVALQEQQAEGKKHRRFYDWWARQGGRKENGRRNWIGTAKKTAVMGVVAIPGVVLGVAGAGAGAILGVAIASRISRGIASAHINKHANAVSVGRMQGEYVKNNGVSALAGREDVLNANDVSDIYQKQTEKINWRNKRRHMGAIALAAGGAVGGHFLHEAFSGHGGGGNHVRAVDSHRNTTPPHSTGGREGMGGNSAPQTPNTGGNNLPRITPKTDHGLPGGATNPGAGDVLPTGPNVVPTTGLIDTSKWKYPYNWVQETFKGENPTTKIHHLEEAARKAGHKVVLHNRGTVNEWVSIDGKSDTAYVVNILNSVNGSEAVLPVTL